MTDQHDLIGQNIRTYVLEEAIGRGGFGAVYRAHQQVVEREVAIKVILPKYANDADFIQSLEREAQFIATLEHPFIVPLYDFWREPNSAYLVMRFLRGGSLTQAIRVHEWTLYSVYKLLDQVAGALNQAHQYGIVHKDVKPDNILLDNSGNAYLTDFGIARDIIGERDVLGREGLFGSVEYMAPELLSQSQITPLVDVYSLGIVLYQLLTGRIPFYGKNTSEIISKQINQPTPNLKSIRPDLPNELNQIIWRATSKNPALRYPDTLALSEDLRDIVFGVTQPTMQQSISAQDEAIVTDKNFDTMQVEPPSTTEVEPPTTMQAELLATVKHKINNPYKGLRSFDEFDAPYYFGRDTFIERLLKHMRDEQTRQEARFVAVVGASGSGKSSVVKAGLIPKLRDDGLPGSHKWIIQKIEPGKDPIAALRQSLLFVAHDLDDVDDAQLMTDPESLHTIFDQAVVDDDKQFVLFIDQFEEIFTMVDAPQQREQFINLLYHAATAPSGRIWIIVALRIDFYDRTLPYLDFGRLMRENTEVVLAMDAAQLIAAILEPAQKVGLTIDPAVATAITAEIANQPGALPLLQFAMSELFDQREDSTISMQSFNAVGGVLGALAGRADALYSELDSKMQDLVRVIFLQLVTIDENAQPTRRKALWSELTAFNDKQAIMDLIDQFNMARLLTFDRDPVSRTPTVQLAHEALISRWERFKGWIDANLEDLRLQRLLRSTVLEWQQAQRDPSYLARGARLLQFETLMGRNDIALSDDEQRYIQASIQARQRVIQQRQLFITALVIISIIAMGAALFAFDREQQAITQRDRADQESQVARSRELAIQSLVGVEAIDLRLLLALQAVDEANTYEARNSLLTALQDQPYLMTLLHGHQNTVRTVDTSADGRLIATGGRDGQIIIWSREDYTQVGEPLIGHDDWVNSVDFHPEQGLLVSGDNSGQAIIWQDNAPIIQDIFTDIIRDVQFSPDGERIAVGLDNGELILWDWANETQTVIPAHDNAIFAVAFHPQDDLIVTGGADNSVRVWNIADESMVVQYDGHSNWILSLAYSDNGEQIISGGADNVAYVWRDDAEEPAFTISHDNWVRSVSFEGTIAITADTNGRIQLGDLPTGQGQSLSVQYPIWQVHHVDDELIVVGEQPAIAILNRTPNAQLRVNTQSVDLPVLSLAINPDGQRIATAHGDPTGRSMNSYVTIWDAMQSVYQLEAHSGPVLDLDFNRAGDLLATVGTDGQVLVWDADIGEQVTAFTHQNVVRALRFTPDGQQIISADDDGVINVWDLAGQTLAQSFSAPDGIMRLAVSSDGQILAAALRNNTIMVWDNWQVRHVLEGHANVVTALAFSSDSTQLVSGARDDQVRLWDIQTGELIGSPLTDHRDFILSVAMSHDGQYIASSDEDGVVILWDAQTQQAIGRPIQVDDDWVNSVAFSLDDVFLYTGGTALIQWHTSLAHWLDQACFTANRLFTEGEVETFALRDEASICTGR